MAVTASAYRDSLPRIAEHLLTLPNGMDFW